MEFESRYEISRTVEFILAGNFSKVALQVISLFCAFLLRRSKSLNNEDCSLLLFSRQPNKVPRVWGDLIFSVKFQFPDELLKDSVRVVRALRSELRRRRESDGSDKDVSLFVMADTAYGSCCVDEVGASHVGADSVVHYGHTCLSPWVTVNLCRRALLLCKIIGF